MNEQIADNIISVVNSPMESTRQAYWHEILKALNSKDKETETKIKSLEGALLQARCWMDFKASDYPIAEVDSMYLNFRNAQNIVNSMVDNIK